MFNIVYKHIISCLPVQKARDIQIQILIREFELVCVVDFGKIKFERN